MDRAERERRYARWSPRTIAIMLCDLEDTYAVVVKERDAAHAEAKRLREVLRATDDLLRRAVIQRDACQDALAFYADPQNHEDRWEPGSRDEPGWIPSLVELDKGARARATLAATESEGQ